MLLNQINKGGIMEKKMVTICAWCKRIKNKKGYSPFNPHALKKLENRGVLISHGICPECLIEFKKGGNSHA
jgi:hypothetical protein